MAHLSGGLLLPSYRLAFKFIHRNRDISTPLIPIVTRPGTCPWLLPQSSLHRIHLTIRDLHQHRLRRAAIVIVTTRRPECLTHPAVLVHYTVRRQFQQMSGDCCACRFRLELPNHRTKLDRWWPVPGGVRTKCAIWRATWDTFRTILTCQ